MELNELQQLIASLEASGLHSLELSRPGESVKLTLGENREVEIETAAQSASLPDLPLSPPPSSGGITVAAESAGVFVATHPMRSCPLAAVGCVVKTHDVLGLLKVGLIYAPITAPADGVVTQILASDGALLGFGAPVLEIAPSTGNV